MKNFKARLHCPGGLRGGAAGLLTALGLGLIICRTPHGVGPARQRVAPATATYANPVIDADFPDPSILRDDGVFYAYSTNSGPNMPCRKSADLVHWTVLPDAMPTLPVWAEGGRTWAPQVRAIVSGRRYVAYFCARVRAGSTQAIGVASGPTPAGPFTASAPVPLIEQPEEGGAIDPSCFLDSDGARYLIWKNDGNSKNRDTWLRLQKLSADGLRLVGPPTRLLRQDQNWEGALVEAPTLWKHGGKYYLFYSANFYGDCRYAMGYAVADALRGPYVKPRDTPWVAGSGDVCGPGGADIVAAGDGRPWMAYHLWAKGPGSYRAASIDPLVWNGDVPSLLGPSRRPQLAPVPMPGLKRATRP